MSMIQTVWFPR